MEILIKVEQDFRKFKKDSVFTLNPVDKGILYLAGRNGSGKTTILRAIRGLKDSLREEVDKDSEGIGMSQNMLTYFETLVYLNISGINDYDEVFCFDSITDDPSSHDNCATLSAMFSGGGWEMQSKSKGEKAGFMLCKFSERITRAINKKYGSVENFVALNKKTLILIDELDEGFDVRMQMRYNYILQEMLIKKYNVTNVICVTHNPLCMLSKRGKMPEPVVYDLDLQKDFTPTEYFKELTGLTIVDKQ